jgi:hypothetical protein
VRYKINSETTKIKIFGGKGDDGRELELSTNATHILWRYVGETAWTNLMLYQNYKAKTAQQAQACQQAAQQGRF